MINPMGDAVLQKLEQLSGVQVEPIGLAEFNEHEKEIRQLRFNVLGTAANDNIHRRFSQGQRKEELKPIHGELTRSAEHEAIYLAKNDSGDIVGFLYIELTPDGRTAEIKEMWSSMHEATQREVVERLLEKACRELPDERYPHLNVTAAERSKYFNHFAANPRFKVLKIRVPEKPENTHAAKSDVTPRADNDGERGQDHHWKEA